MKFRKEASSLAIAAGLLAAGPALGQGNQTEVWSDYYLSGQIGYPPPANLPGATSIGVSGEVTQELAERRTEREQIAERMPRADLETETRLREQIALLERDVRDLQAQMRSQQGQQQGDQQARLQALERELNQVQAQLQEQERQLQQARTQQQDQRAQATRQPLGQDVATVPPPVTPQLVRELQQQLRSVGLSPGPVDGIWGPETHQALTRYQRDNNLQPSGQLDPPTLAALDLSQDGQQARQQQSQRPQQQAALEEEQRTQSQ